MTYRNEIITFFHKIETNFALDYPEEYAKLTGWCSAPVFTLPKNDVLEILGCTKREDYIKLFMKKI
jgi:hypothetical protein